MSEQKSALSVKVEVDTKEANENIKELTTAVNECVEAFEKLEKVMGRFKGKSGTKGIKGIIVEISTVLNGETLASDIVKSVNDSNSNIRI
ncbi:hypothetical protein [Bacillus toyonensis]|uniref:hypothetical protein n=1 Tax=Bacillus toyonensis TaxID=155322 RepID=UPI002E1EBECC|nr:hypothetical protein [Bacillus toyonensis]